MTRAGFQQLAATRAADAAALLAASRWSGAYYLAGYAVECGLKACVMKRVGAEEGGMLFDPDQGGFQRQHCLTHNFQHLFAGADLWDQFCTEVAARRGLRDRWAIASQWTEAARYLRKTQPEAEAMYDAVTDPADGLLPWIQRFW